MFGNNFLTRFEGAQSNVDILKNLTLIDSPGVLSGEKQTLGRSYSYDDVLNWFAERSDMIILLFDVQKLDISDEMGSAIKVLQKYSDKIKVRERGGKAWVGGGDLLIPGSTESRLLLIYLPLPPSPPPTGCPQQGGYNFSPTAHEGVWSTFVVSRKSD